MKGIADFMVRIPVRTKNYLEDEIDSCQPMTSLFEQAVLLVGDILAKIIIEDILPCQMGITYWFRYCTWQETQDYGLTWADVNAMTWHEWETYHEDPA